MWKFFIYMCIFHLRNSSVPGTSGRPSRFCTCSWSTSVQCGVMKSPAAVTCVVTSPPATTLLYWTLCLPCVWNSPKDCVCVRVCARPCVLALAIVFTATRPAICSEAQTQHCVLFEGCCRVWPAPPSASLTAPPQSPVSPQLSGWLSNSGVLFSFQWVGVWVECPVLCEQAS